MKRGLGCILIGLVAVSATLSNAASPEQSLVPLARPLAEPVMAFSSPAKPTKLRPALRPVSPQVLAVAARPSDLPLLGPDTSLMPYLRPKSLEQEVLFKKRKLRKGSVCGDIDIQGKPVGKVPGQDQGLRNKGCRSNHVSFGRRAQPSVHDGLRYGCRAERMGRQVGQANF